MIKRKLYMTRSDGVNLYRTYSDSNLMIKEIESENIYQEAIDIEGANYTYEETDIPIEEEEFNDISEQDYLNALAKLGVE